MPLDPSIPLSGKLPQSPLAGLGDTTNIANSLLQLQSNSQKLQANQVISKAYSQATDPQTGQVDFGRLQALATQGGAGAFLPEFMGKLAEQRNSQQSYDTGKLDLALKQQGDIRNRIGSLMASPNFGKSDMTNEILGTMGEAVANGTLPMNMAVRGASNIPKDAAGQADWIKQHYLNSLSGEAKIHAMLPQTQMVNTGGQTQILNIDPLTGQPKIVAGLQNTLSPGEATTPVQGVSPTGTPYVVTKQQWLNGQGAPGQSQGGYTGRPTTSGAEVPQGALQTGLSPAEQARQTTAASASATQSTAAAQNLHDSAADVPMRISLLNQARDALSGVNTGPGSDWRNTAKSFFNSLAPDTAKSIGWSGDVKDYDEFKKILTNYASSVSGSLGTGTDARLNAAVTGNANPNISKTANEDILVKTLAAEKMRQAQDYAFQNSGLTTDKFNQWQSQWNKTVNPDAFAFVEMSPDQQKSFLDRQQKSGSLNKFKSDLGNLVRGGIIQPPGGQ